MIKSEPCFSTLLILISSSPLLSLHKILSPQNLLSCSPPPSSTLLTTQSSSFLNPPHPSFSPTSFLTLLPPPPSSPPAPLIVSKWPFQPAAWNSNDPPSGSWKHCLIYWSRHFATTSHLIKPGKQTVSSTPNNRRSEQLG